MDAVKAERSPEAIGPYAQARRAGDLIFVSGGSTGTNFFALCRIAAQMIDKREKGSLVTLICDSGDRSAGTYYSDDWLRQNNIDIAPYCEMLETFLDTGRFPEDSPEILTARRN